MPRSMTAFGRSRQNIGGKDICVEIKSVNNRYLDCQVRLPRRYSYLEQRIKPYLQESGISRGKVDVSITVDLLQATETDVSVNIEYAKRYVEALRELGECLGLQDDISVSRIAAVPDVLTFTKKEDDERDWEDIEQVLRCAVAEFLTSGRAEGDRIRSDLICKAKGIEACIDKISERSEQDIGGYRTRLEERLRAALSDNSITIDESRILTECAIYADRAAIDEELVRLRSHFCAFYEYLDSDEPIGRSLDFLLQEMNREINTTGSKCANAQIARLVVDVKTELEKIREQIQNLE